MKVSWHTAQTHRRAIPGSDRWLKPAACPAGPHLQRQRAQNHSCSFTSAQRLTPWGRGGAELRFALCKGSHVSAQPGRAAGTRTPEPSTLELRSRHRTRKDSEPLPLPRPANGAGP